MTATKWRVRKDRWPDGDEYGGWFVFPPGRDWGELWHSDIALFDGHPEALAYADRMARTVEVELPRVGERTAIPQREDMGMGINWSILAEWDDYDPSQLMISGPYGQMYIYAQDIKKTALALLAMARKEQQ